MIINWYGEGCFKIQTGGIILLIDPFESNIGLTSPRGKIDIILETITPWPIKDEKNKFREEKIIRGGGEYEVKGIAIKGFSLTKESSDKFFKTAYKVIAENLTLGFLGHLSEELSTESLEGLKNADIIFVPAGGSPFLNQAAAAKLIKQLDPKVVIASFFKVPKLKRKSDDWKNLAKEIGQKPEILEKLTIKKRDLSEQKEIRLVVLES